MSASENPLLAALPPATDYLTYLTLIEYNLTVDNLPVLHQVLQDTQLTTNIGWDLVHLLLPLLPHSEQCLQDVARLGNPREVVLKVTEALRLLDFGDLKDESEEDEHQGAAADQPEHLTASKDAQSATDAGGSSSRTAPEAAVKLPLPVLQFKVLLSMLATMHSRIKTNFPSRFLSTSLQAVLASYSEANSHVIQLTTAVVTFIKTLSGAKRPHLPPRVSSSQIVTAASGQKAEDPEAQGEPPSKEEMALQRRLLQSFLTHILEDFMLNLSSVRDIPGMAWASRLQEKLNPERIVPGKPTYAQQFAKEEDLRARSETVGQIVAVAQDLELDSKDLFSAVRDETAEATGLPSEEDEPPATAEDIPFSKKGALFLLTARKASEKLFDISSSNVPLSIFPDHATILRAFVGEDLTGNIGTEPEALIDSILTLGLLALEDNDIGEPEDDEHFTKYLQTTSLLSANTPSPSLRYDAHYLTSTVLRSHPSDVVRLSFIRDTLEHCPYENLKASAVGWLKGETLEASMSTLVPGSKNQASTASNPEHPSIFATPVALSTVSPFLFPDLTHDLSTPSLEQSWTRFKLNLSFYLATLNFYWLLLSAKHLHETLDIPGLHQSADVGGSFLWPLREAMGRFEEGLKEGGQLWEMEGGHDGVRAAEADLRLLGHALDRVEQGVKALNGVKG